MAITPQQLGVGSIVQLKPNTFNHYFTGCLLVVTDIHSWGVIGYIMAPASVTNSAVPHFYRAKWQELALTGGTAPWQIGADDQLVPLTTDDTPAPPTIVVDPAKISIVTGDVSQITLTNGLYYYVSHDLTPAEITELKSAILHNLTDNLNQGLVPSGKGTRQINRIIFCR